MSAVFDKELEKYEFGTADNARLGDGRCATATKLGHGTEKHRESRPNSCVVERSWR